MTETKREQEIEAALENFELAVNQHEKTLFIMKELYNRAKKGNRTALGIIKKGQAQHVAAVRSRFFQQVIDGRLNK